MKNKKMLGPVTLSKEKIMDVYYITIAGERSGYYEENLDHLIDMLKDSPYGEGYTITREVMKPSEYDKLPEFMGW